MSFSKLFQKKDPRQLQLEEGNSGLHRNLTFIDLTSMAIAAVIGAGIFSTIGRASFEGGPAVTLLFLFTAIACLCSALCYAHFASSVRVSGSAYSYAYVSFGELIAWIIGWDLLMEYAIGNIAVAISWSDYFTNLLHNLNINFPAYLSIDYLSAKTNHAAFLTSNQEAFIEGYSAWTNAPFLFNNKIILDLPALFINLIITLLVYIGIKESKRTGNFLVLIKLIVILIVLTVGVFYINPENWTPFAPNGLTGIFKGTSAVFFAYIGFDAISTTTEECINPQKDLPKAMIWSLIICTILYIAISMVLTGMVNYTSLNVGDPIAFVFTKHQLTFMSELISISAIVAMTGVLLVFQLGQPRILMSMSRDNLLPKAFGKIHPKFKTPSFSTIVTGIMVAIPILFLNHATVTDLCAIGTLFAFSIVCAGVLVDNNQSNGFKIPYYNSKFSIPIGFILIGVLLLKFNTENIRLFLTTFKPEDITLWLFLFYSIIISYYSFVKNLSLIPVIGLSCNLYLITELGLTNWIRFGIWLLLGLVIYFLYGFRKNKPTH